MENFKLTVFTPTYNRAYILPNCYQSLCNQTNKDFHWLIVDDGSTDNTAELVKNWVNEGIISIQYIYQKNAGKQRAMNTAIKSCQTEIIADLDSDDCYLPETVAKILECFGEISNNTKVAGIIGRRSDSNGKIIGSNNIPEGKYIANYDRLLGKYGYFGDTNRAYKTKILAQYLFPEIEDKFIPEDVMWSKVDQKYDLYIVNQSFAVSEYLADGYTKNTAKLYKQNPLGVQLSYNQLMLSNRGIKYNMIASVMYTTWSWKCKMKNSFLNCQNKKRYLLALPISLLCTIIKYPAWIYKD